MGNFISCTYENFAPVSSVTAITEHASFPASYTRSYTTPWKLYKSTAAAGTAQAIVIDFGSAQSLDGVMIDNTNVTAVKIQGNATNSWGTPSYSGTVTISQDPLDGRYKVFHDLQGTGFDVTGYRYLRVQCNTSTTQWGGTVWAVGAVIPMGTVTTWDTNTGPIHGRVRLQSVDAGTKLGGGGEPAALGNPYARIVIPAATLGTAMWTTYDTLMRNGEHQPLVFYRNFGTTSETYCCHRVGISRVDYSNPGRVNVDQLVLDEYA